MTLKRAADNRCSDWKKKKKEKKSCFHRYRCVSTTENTSARQLSNYCIFYSN